MRFLPRFPHLVTGFFACLVAGLAAGFVAALFAGFFSGFFAGGAPADTGIDETVNIAVENRVGIPLFVPGAQILDHLVGLKHIGTHLVAPRGFDISAQFFLFARFLFLFEEEQARL